MERVSEPGRAPEWMTPQGPREGLGRYAEVIRERRKLIILCVLVVTIAAGLYAKLASPEYKAEAHLLVKPVKSETNLIGLGLSTEPGNPPGDVSTAASLVTTSEVAALVAA